VGVTERDGKKGKGQPQGGKKGVLRCHMHGTWKKEIGCRDFRRVMLVGRGRGTAGRSTTFGQKTSETLPKANRSPKIEKGKGMERGGFDRTERRKNLVGSGRALGKKKQCAWNRDLVEIVDHKGTRPDVRKKKFEPVTRRNGGQAKKGTTQAGGEPLCEKKQKDSIGKKRGRSLHGGMSL